MIRRVLLFILKKTEFGSIMMQKNYGLNRKDTKEIPIIAMTANAFQDDIRDCIDAGMNAHIAKPIDSKKIEDTLQLVLKQKMQ